MTKYKILLLILLWEAIQCFHSVRKNHWRLALNKPKDVLNPTSSKYSKVSDIFVLNYASNDEGITDIPFPTRKPYRKSTTAKTKKPAVLPEDKRRIKTILEGLDLFTSEVSNPQNLTCPKYYYIQTITLYQTAYYSKNGEKIIDDLGISRISILCVDLLTLNQTTSFEYDLPTISHEKKYQAETQMATLSCPTFITGYRTLNSKFVGCDDNLGMVGVEKKCASSPKKPLYVRYVAKGLLGYHRHKKGM